MISNGIRPLLVLVSVLLFSLAGDGVATADAQGLFHGALDSLMSFAEDEASMAPAGAAEVSARPAELLVAAAPARPPVFQTGTASFYGYGDGFHGRRTANGEIFDTWKLTAAHKTLAFGTRVEVTRLDTGTSVVVRINDRGPYAGGRIIDLSTAAADRLGMRSAGVARVSLRILR